MYRKILGVNVYKNILYFEIIYKERYFYSYFIIFYILLEGIWEVRLVGIRIIFSCFDILFN